MLFDIISLILLTLLALLFLPSLFNPVSFAPPVPSNTAHRRWILDRLKHNGLVTVCEVGCGWGGLSLQLAKLDNVTEVHAIELSPLLVIICWIRFKLSPYRNKLSLTYGNALRKQTINLIQQDVITLYTFKEFNNQFFPQLPKGKVVLSSCFKCPSIPLKEEKVGIGTMFEYLS